MRVAKRLRAASCTRDDSEVVVVVVVDDIMQLQSLCCEIVNRVVLCVILLLPLVVGFEKKGSDRIVWNVQKNELLIGIWSWREIHFTCSYCFLFFHETCSYSISFPKIIHSIPLALCTTLSCL